jgi:hypothetical protein
MRVARRPGRLTALVTLAAASWGARTRAAPLAAGVVPSWATLAEVGGLPIADGLAVAPGSVALLVPLDGSPHLLVSEDGGRNWTRAAFVEDASTLCVAALPATATTTSPAAAASPSPSPSPAPAPPPSTLAIATAVLAPPGGPSAFALFEAKASLGGWAARAVANGSVPNDGTLSLACGPSAWAPLSGSAASGLAAVFPLAAVTNATDDALAVASVGASGGWVASAPLTDALPSATSKRAVPVGLALPTATAG